MMATKSMPTLVSVFDSVLLELSGCCRPAPFGQCIVVCLSVKYGLFVCVFWSMCSFSSSYGGIVLFIFCAIVM